MCADKRKTTSRLPYGYLDQYKSMIEDLASKHFNTSYIAKKVNEVSECEVSYISIYKFMERNGISNRPEVTN